MIKKTALVLAAIAATASSQAAESKALSVTADISYVTDYVFRGVKLADASIQPSVEAAYADFYAGVWNTNSISSATNVNETDLYAGYGFKATDTIKLDVGVTRYTYSGGGTDDTTEAYVGASADVLLKPSLYYYYDFDLEVSSVEASIGYSLPVDAIKASLDFSGKVGYVKGHDAPAGSIDDYTYFVAGVSVPYKLSETATLTVGVDYIYNTEDTIAGFNGGDSDIIVGKAGISIGF